MDLYKSKLHYAMISQIACLTAAFAPIGASASPGIPDQGTASEAKELRVRGHFEPSHWPTMSSDLGFVEAVQVGPNTGQHEGSCDHVRIRLKRASPRAFSVRFSFLDEAGKAIASRLIDMPTQNQEETYNFDNPLDLVPVVSFSIKSEPNVDWKFCWAVQCIDRDAQAPLLPELKCESGPSPRKEDKFSIAETNIGTVIDIGSGPPGDVIEPPDSLAALRHRVLRWTGVGLGDPWESWIGDWVDSGLGGIQREPWLPFPDSQVGGVILPERAPGLESLPTRWP